MRSEGRGRGWPRFGTPPSESKPDDGNDDDGLLLGRRPKTSSKLLALPLGFQEASARARRSARCCSSGVLVEDEGFLLHHAGMANWATSREIERDRLDIERERGG